MGGMGSLKALSCCVVLCGLFFTAVAYAQQNATLQPASPTLSRQSSQAANPSSQPSNPPLGGSITGTVMDQGGAVAIGATIRLTRPNQPQAQEVLSGNDGQFSFSDLAPGPFQLTITAPGFDPKTFEGELQPGQVFLVPAIVLNIARATTTVSVAMTTQQLAQIQIKQQETQRVLGIFPNFYVSYIHDAAPMTSGQKFQLAWKAVTDPVTILGVSALAGLQQATNDDSRCGQEAGGYGMRFSAAYATTLTEAFVDDAILASLLKQDPRYFYQGTGTIGSRLRHALAHAVVRKGDNGRWQPSYSGILGSFASAGLSSLYYPESDRSGGLVVQNAAIGIAGRAVGAIFEEFVLKKFTTHASGQPTPQP